MGRAASIVLAAVVAAGAFAATPVRMYRAGKPSFPRSSVVSSFGLGANGTWGLPYTPTEDCIGSQFTGGATWACSGITMTKAGTPTAGRPSAFWPFGFGGTNAVSTEFTVAGTDFFWADETGQRPSAARSVCVEFHAHTVAGVQSIWGADDLADERQYTLLLNEGVLEWCVFKDPLTYSTLTIGTVTSAPFAWNTACFSYDPSGGDGAAVLRGALNGIASTPVTTGVAPAYVGTADLMFGARGSHLASQDGFGGDIRRVTRWTGRVLTQAEMITANRHSMGAVGSGGEEIPFTRNSATTCTQNGVVNTLGNNFLCLNENGLQVFGAGTSNILYSEDLTDAAWTKRNLTITANNTAAPDGTLTADKITLTAGAGLHDAYQVFTQAAGAGTGSVFLKAGTATTVNVCVAGVGAGVEVNLTNCAVTTVIGGAGPFAVESLANGWCRASLVDTMTGGGADYLQVVPAKVAADGCFPNWDPAGTETIFVWGGDVKTGATLSPYIPTTNAAATKNADVASRPAIAGIDNSGAAGADVTLPPIWSETAGVRILGMTNAPLAVASATSVRIDDGTATATATTANLTTGTRRVVSAWDAGAGKMIVFERGGTAATADYDGTMGEADPIYIGSDGSGNFLNGWIRAIRHCRGGGWDKNAAGACQ